jgi:group I intron endonuclease
MNKRLVVYLATCRPSGRSYVGLTGSPLDLRRKEHQWAAKRGVRSSFYAALRKHGNEAFQWGEIAECADREALNACEAYYVRELGTQRCGYNMTSGADGAAGYVHSASSKATIAEARAMQYQRQPRRQHELGFNRRAGRKLTMEHKAKISAGLAGHRNALKLHEESVPQILRRLDAGESRTAIACDLGVDRMTVTNAIKRYAAKVAP